MASCGDPSERKSVQGIEPTYKQRLYLQKHIFDGERVGSQNEFFVLQKLDGNVVYFADGQQASSTSITADSGIYKVDEKGQLKHPGGRIDDAHHHVEYLQHHPGDQRVGDGHPEDVSSFQFGKKAHGSIFMLSRCSMNRGSSRSGSKMAMRLAVTA